MNVRDLTGLLTGGYAEEIEAAVGSLMRYGSQVRPLADALGVYWVDSQAKAIKRFETEHGFTREEAMLLVCNMKEELAKCASGARRK